MCRSRLNFLELTVCLGLLLHNFEASALEIEPGVGLGLEYTDNAALTAENPLDDLIVIGYAGARLEENDGPLKADITAALNHQNYTQDTFQDQLYFNLKATAGWAMIKNRFEWVLENYFTQRPVNSTDPDTPNNIQDNNSFIFAANISFPVSARQTFTLLPEYRNFYYEIQPTDNQQFSLAASWLYGMSVLTSVGLNASVRKVDYDDDLIDDLNFGSIFFVFSNIRARSEIKANMGTTYVERESGQSTSEFTGNLNWLVNLTSRSKIRTYIASDLTNSSNSALYATVDPEVGDPNNIQINTDVVRYQIISLGYHRKDGTLDSSLTGELSKLTYSDSPDDRGIWNVSAVLNYPVTALLSSGLYARHNNTDYSEINRKDRNYTISGGIRYQLSRNLRSQFDLTYRKRDSTVALQNFDEWSVFASLTYGFGQVMRPARSGGGF